MNSWLHTPLASSQPSQTGSQVFCPKLQEPNLVVKVEDWWFWITYYVGNGARTQSSGWGNIVCRPWFHPLGSAKKLRGWGLGESHFKWLVKWAVSLCLFAPSYSTAWMINPTFTKGLTTNTLITLLHALYLSYYSAFNIALLLPSIRERRSYSNTRFFSASIYLD